MAQVGLKWAIGPDPLHVLKPHEEIVAHVYKLVAKHWLKGELHNLLPMYQ